jgi:hypothetical protein
MNIFRSGWLSNTVILVISGTMSGIVVILGIFDTYLKQDLCYRLSNCVTTINTIAALSFLFFSFLFFSVLFLFQKNKEKFTKWRKFSLLFLLVYVLIVAIFPWYIGDGFMSFQKSQVVILLTIIHFIISLFFLFGTNKSKLVSSK